MVKKTVVPRRQKLMTKLKKIAKRKSRKVKFRKTMVLMKERRIKPEVIKTYEENKLTLPHLPFNDNFLSIMSGFFNGIKYMAIPVQGGNFVVTFFVIQFGMLMGLEVAALYKVFKVLAGKTLFATGNRSVIARISGTIFYSNAVVSLVLLWKFRGAWRKLSAEWASTERSTGLYLPPDAKLRRKMLFVIFFIVSGTIVEHGLSMASNTGLDCPISEFFERYIIASHAFIMIQSDYDVRLGIVIFIVNKTATFLWNLQDLVIILFSIGLTSRYNRLNSYVAHIKKQIDAKKSKKSEFDEYIESQLWRKLREAYVRQAALVRRVDKDLGALILLSNANNFYFICLQVFNGIGGTKILSPINRIYFGVSISWLFIRACSVVLAAADINIQSKEALKSIHSYPEECYNVEVRRLERQLSKDFVALTGMGFFHLNRNMLLEVGAAIFRYELILLEFDR